MKKTTLLISILTLCFLQFDVFGQTSVPNTISSDAVWDISGSPYQLAQHSTIDTGVSVTVMPGVVLESVGQRFKLRVNGELQFLGTADSMITVEEVEVSYTSLSLSNYDSLHIAADVNYTRFIGSGNGTRALSIYNRNVMVENCYFEGTYYGIHAVSNVVTSLSIKKCEFTGDNAGYGDVLHVHTANSTLEVDDCYFHDINVVRLYSAIDFTNNKLDRVNSLVLGPFGESHISCNYIKNMKYYVSVSLYGHVNGPFYFNNNTLDSCGTPNTSFTYPMLKLTVSEYMPSSSIDISENNFLNTNGSNAKVETSGGVLNANIPTVSIQGNYWMTSDTAAIQNMIIDHSTDSTRTALLDFSNPLLSMDTICPYVTDGSGTLSVEKLAVRDILVYPNPASSRLFVETDVKQVRSISIVSLDGRVMSINPLEDKSIDVSELTPGLYILVIQDNKGNRAASRFVKL